jgi:hypothetical protein
MIVAFSYPVAFAYLTVPIVLGGVWRSRGLLFALALRFIVVAVFSGWDPVPNALLWTAGLAAFGWALRTLLIRTTNCLRAL